MDQIESTISQVEHERELEHTNAILAVARELRRKPRTLSYAEPILVGVGLLLTLFLAFSAGVSYSRLSMTDLVLENAREVNTLAREHEQKTGAAMQRAQQTEAQAAALLDAIKRARQLPAPAQQHLQKDGDAAQVPSV